MFAIVLYEPEIPPNTGNALRLAANTGAKLHLVRPLGFTLSNKRLVRAGLDYSDLQALTVHDDWTSCVEALQPRRVFAVTTRGARRYDDVRYGAGDAFVFGPETRGLPQHVLDTFPPDRRICIPMREGNRSLNLSNAVAVVVYEAWRQNGFV